jgi:hypothetical protein
MPFFFNSSTADLPAVNTYSSTRARIGQNLTHFPHFMHLSMSTVGAALSFWESAPTGHTLTDGQAWFCGHLLFLTDSAMFPLSFFSVSLLSSLNRLKKPMIIIPLSINREISPAYHILFYYKECSLSFP